MKNMAEAYFDLAEKGTSRAWFLLKVVGTIPIAIGVIIFASPFVLFGYASEKILKYMEKL